MIRFLTGLITILFSLKAFASKVVEIGIASNFSELSTVSFNPFGGYFKDAIELAIQDQKENLDKAGLQIKLKEFDYGINDLNIIKTVKEASTSKVVAVIGYNYSSSALMAAPLHVEAKLPMVSPSASANRLGTFENYVHLGSFNNGFMARTLAKISAEILNKRKVLILTAVNCAYCVDLSDTFSREIQNFGGRVVKNIAVIQEDTDFSLAVKEAKDLDFDVIFIPNQELTAARIISAFIESGIDKPFLGADGWGNEGSEFFRVLKGKKFTGYSVTHWHPKLNTEKSKRFVRNYLNKFHKLPNDTSVLAFDSMTMLIEAILKTKNLSRESLNSTLLKTRTFEGVTGKALWEPNQAPKKDIVILKTTDSSFAIHQVIPADVKKVQQ